MPVSMTTLQIYDQYLTTYRDKDSTKDVKNTLKEKAARFATHDTSELESVYSNIQWHNRFTPVYLTEPTPKSIAYAVHLKESANSLKQTINYLSESDEDVFAAKSAYSDNESLATVEYVPSQATDDTPTDFDLKIESFATPQINIGSYLESDTQVGLKPGSYSFDLLTNKLHYEIQFNINKGETNLDLQSKIMRLINDSGIGVSAKVYEDDGYSALEITSDNVGIPYQGERHFDIADENTSYTKGVVDYLGLNQSVHEAENAVYSINGDEGSSYSNTFKVHGAYHITLHPENGFSSGSHIGLTADAESIANNIKTFVDEYNSFLLEIVGDEENDKDTKILSDDMKKFLESHAGSLSANGITINDDSTISYEKLTDITDDTSIKLFGANLLEKLSSITIDPMEYVDRAICAYPNPNSPYPNPYVTSIYSGMLINVYV